MPAQRPVRIERIQATILHLIGPQLARQANPPAFLRQIQHHPRALRGDPGQGSAQLRPAITAQAAQQIAGEALGMQPDQRCLHPVRLADDDGQVLDPGVGRAEGDQSSVRRILQRYCGLGYLDQGGGFRIGVAKDFRRGG